MFVVALPVPVVYVSPAEYSTTSTTKPPVPIFLTLPLPTVPPVVILNKSPKNYSFNLRTVLLYTLAIKGMTHANR